MNISEWLTKQWATIYAARKSPLTLVLAVVFVVQPVVSTGFDLIGDISFLRQKLDPSTRPVTKAEFDLLNAKVDTLQSSLNEDIKKDKEIIGGQKKAPAANYGQYSDALTTLQKKLDTAYIERKK